MKLISHMKKFETMDNETKKRIADYFDAADLVDYLQIETSEVVERFEDEIEEVLEEIEELMEFRRNHE